MHTPTHTQTSSHCRTGASSPTEVRQGSPVRRMGFKAGNRFGDSLLLQLLGNQHEDQPAHLLHMCRGSPKSRLDDSVGLPVESLSSCVPQSSQQLFHKTPQAPSNVGLWSSASLSIGYWVEPFRGQQCEGLVCKHNSITLIVSGIGSCPLDESQFWPVMCWLFPQFLSLHIL